MSEVKEQLEASMNKVTKQSKELETARKEVASRDKAVQKLREELERLKNFFTSFEQSWRLSPLYKETSSD